MLELIRELARQADPEYTGENDGDMGHALVGDEAIQKFAELILVEVMQELFINGYEDAFDFLNKHFGIAE